MPIVINELTVDIQSPTADIPIGAHGLSAEDTVNTLLMDLELAEERSKRLVCD